MSTISAPPLREMVDRLIATPSVSSSDPSRDMSNRAVVNLLAEWTETLGFDVEVMEIPGKPDKANLIATLGSGPGGLVLSGHTDTVPFDEGKWATDPFAATEQDNRIYGLGSADMKSFLALALAAAMRFRDHRLREPLTIIGTADEESTMSGARALVDAKRAPGRLAVIGEPTGLRPVRMHKGVQVEIVRIEGRSGHSSDPSLGRNALEALHRAIGAILAYRGEVEAERNEAFAVPTPTINLGKVVGGDSFNRICASAELHFDARVLPSMNGAELRETLRARIRDAVGPEFGIRFDDLGGAGTQPFLTPANSELVRAAEELTGAPAGAVAFGTEGPFYNALGMDTIVLGPGSIDVAHQPDEYLELSYIDRTVDLLEQMIGRFCI
ncbi:MAG: acetylornithine deacetylase [Myxococcota bacterium]